jgi:hypothetical protein
MFAGAGVISDFLSEPKDFRLEHVIDDEESFNIEQRWYINSIQYSAL